MSIHDHPSNKANVLDDQLNPTFSFLVKNLQDIHIPWKKQTITLGTGLRLGDKSEPKVAHERDAFTESSLHENFVFIEESCLTYKEIEANAASLQSEHKSVSASVSVGGSLLGASVEGGFNSALKASVEGQKTSIHGACRLGIITFKEEPGLRLSARKHVHPRWLRYPDDGRFASIYGDYYVAGLILGANSSVVAVIDETERQSEEHRRIKFTIKILLKTKSGQIDKHESDYQAYSKVSLLGFDSLTGSCVGLDSISNRTASWSDRTTLQNFVTLGKTLEERARKVMKSLGLQDGMTVNHELCERVCQSGLVVELLLRPMSKLSTYIEAAYEK